VVNDGGTSLLTRAGNFSADLNGNLITANGLSVMGFPAVNGVVNTNAPLAPVQIPMSSVQPPSATSTFGMTANLDSAASVGSSISGKVQIYDSLGSDYQATVTYTKQANNSWTYSISMPDMLQADSSAAAGVSTINFNFGSSGGAIATVNPSSNLTITGPNGGGISTTITAPVVAAGESVDAYAADLQSALTAAGIPGAVTSTAAGQLIITGVNISTSGSVIQDPVASNCRGTLTFDSNGNLVSPASNVGGISFSGLSDGASNMNMTWDLFGANGAGTISQVDQSSAVTSTIQNGFPSGDYSGFTIGSDGTVTATFNNGQKLNVGLLALANVINLQGLEHLGGSDYATTLASGTATVSVSGTAGLGTMEGGALEASNVNISAEFANLIIAQHAFEANSKAVTTFDNVTQTTINMIH